MKQATLLLIFLLLSGVAFAQIATEPGDMRAFKTPQTSPDAPFDTRGEPSPFEDELNLYYNKRAIGSTEFLWGGVATIGGLVTTSSLLTLQGLGKVDPNMNNYFVITSYSITGVAALVAVWGLFEWINATNAYSDTVRLASQYYNIID